MAGCERGRFLSIWLAVIGGAIFLWCGGAYAQDTSSPPPAPKPENSQSEATPQNQTPGNDKPQPQPQEEKKDDSENPAAAVADKTKDLTVQAAEATKQLGEAALDKARDWERGWFVGVYVQKSRALVPMTAKQRREIYLEETFTTSSPYLKRLFVAGLDQARDSPPQWGGGWAGYRDRFASREGQFMAANSLAAVGNAALKYEPRYDECRCSGFWRRTRHAIVRNFLTYDETERQLRPQWALYGGAFGGGMIATAWKPHPLNPFSQGGIAMAEQGAFGAALNLFIEFSSDVDRKVWVRNK